MITQIIGMLVSPSLVPYVELFIIYILIRDLKNFISDNWDVDYRAKFREDLRKLKEVLVKEKPEDSSH
jgi:ABC-type transport system involved in cytochrome bd biosynthesis fused ATPase/permease subunit